MSKAPAMLLLVLACWQGGGARPRLGRASSRLASLHDVTTELVVALGATDRLVGIGDPVDLPGDVLAAVAHVPRVAGLESVLAVHPEVVLGLGVIAEQDPELVERLRHRGIEVFLADPATLEDVQALTRSVAQRVGATGAGERLVAALRARGDGYGRGRRRVRVFVYDCCDPPFTSGGKTVLSDLIERAGGHNVFADLDAGWTHVSWEEVVARRPELVVVHAYRYGGQGDVPDKQRALRAIPSLANLPTTVIPLGCSLGGLRSAEGLERLRLAIGERP